MAQPEDYQATRVHELLKQQGYAGGYETVKRAFRTLKTTLDLRPLYHRKDERIHAHVLLCFLALLLVRIAERQSGLTWDQIRASLQRLHLGEFASKDGRILQRTELTPEQANLLTSLNIPPPPRVYSVSVGS